MSSSSMRTQPIYVVLENGDLYPDLYHTYEAARDAVVTKYADVLEYQREECAGMPYPMASKVDVDENTGTGTTHLYVERGISITIQRYKIGMPQ
jgi:hypothetical protein